jgi:hypothetical protein
LLAAPLIKGRARLPGMLGLTMPPTLLATVDEVIE